MQHYSNEKNELILHNVNSGNIIVPQFHFVSQASTQYQYCIEQCNNWSCGEYYSDCISGCNEDPTVCGFL